MSIEPDPSRPAPPAARGRSRVWRVVFIAIGALAVVLLLITGVTAWSVLSTIQAVERIPDAFPAEADRPTASTGDAAEAMNFLLLGADAGDGSGSLAQIDGQHADTLVVVHVPADRSQLTVMSIPRDTRLTVPGHGETKVSAAIALGGVPLAVQTVETLLDTRLDHVAVVNFAGFEGVTDALGGVTVDNPIAFDSHYLSGHRFDAGEQHLDGVEALAFAREQAAFPDGDIQRVRNQQLLIGSLFGGIMQQSTLTDPGKLGGVIVATTEHLAIDETLASTDLVGLGLQLRDVRSDDVVFFTIPTVPAAAEADGQAVVTPDPAALPGVQEGFRSDTLDEVAAALQPVG